MELVDTGTTIRLKYLQLEGMEQGDRILELEWEAGWSRLILGGAFERLDELEARLTDLYAKNALIVGHLEDALEHDDEPAGGYYKI
jgi:hypothetical protein